MFDIRRKGAVISTHACILDALGVAKQGGPGWEIWRSDGVKMASGRAVPFYAEAGRRAA